METLNRNHISYQEMDGLIGLAEEVSTNIETLNGKIKTERIKFTLNILSITICLLTVMYVDIDNFINIFFAKNTSLNFSTILLLFCGLLFISIFFLNKRIDKIDTIIRKEETVLKKLLNMIEGYKDLYIENEYSNESSVLSKALFRMRLSRINFGVK
ncbi:MAG: hypothetical protein RLZZ306_2418 [Bacteroidota bacterium]|jgi:hypothetical protein